MTFKKISVLFLMSYFSIVPSSYAQQQGNKKFDGNILDPRELTVKVADGQIFIQNSKGDVIFDGRPSEDGPLKAEKWRTIIRTAKDSNRLIQVFRGRNTDDSVEVSTIPISQELEREISDLKKKLAACEDSKKSIAISDGQLKELKETIEQLSKKMEGQARPAK